MNDFVGAKVLSIDNKREKAKTRKAAKTGQRTAQNRIRGPKNFAWANSSQQSTWVVQLVLVEDNQHASDRAVGTWIIKDVLKLYQ